MSKPDLPENVEMNIVRRWVCGNCGDWGWRDDECQCGSETWEKINGRHLQFIISK